MSEPDRDDPAAAAASRIVPKRRVATTLGLANGERIAGQIYVAIEGAGGKPERVADRMNDLDEHYLPVAVEERHVLVRKSKVVTVHLARERLDEADLEAATDVLSVRVVLTDGTRLEGDLHARPLPTGSRALDYLNGFRPRFIPLLAEGVTLVNGDYVVAVEELRPRSAPGPVVDG